MTHSSCNFLADFIRGIVATAPNTDDDGFANTVIAAIPPADRPMRVGWQPREAACAPPLQPTSSTHDA